MLLFFLSLWQNRKILFSSEDQNLFYLRFSLFFNVWNINSKYKNLVSKTSESAFLSKLCQYSWHLFLFLPLKPLTSKCRFKKSPYKYFLKICEDTIFLPVTTNTKTFVTFKPKALFSLEPNTVIEIFHSF